MRYLALLVLFVFSLSPVAAELQSRVVNYKHEKKKLQGYVVYEADIRGPRPGVLVIHAWKGHDEFVRNRADELAKMGYVAFALDMYGKGIYAKDHKEAAELSGAVKNNDALLLGRAMAGLEQLKQHKFVDRSRLAAIGYCFGGWAVLSLARADAGVNAVVAFHPAGLPDYKDVKEGQVNAAILINNGSNDPMVEGANLLELQSEFERVGADWQVVNFGGAAHGFATPGSGYDKNADQRSWDAMKALFNSVF